MNAERFPYAKAMTAMHMLMTSALSLVLYTVAPSLYPSMGKAKENWRTAAELHAISERNQESQQQNHLSLGVSNILRQVKNDENLMNLGIPSAILLLDVWFVSKFCSRLISGSMQAFGAALREGFTGSSHCKTWNFPID